MTRERWERLAELYNAAVTREPAARAMFLDSACGSDVTLRTELESLLRHGLPSTPAMEMMAADFARSRSTIVGSRLGPYRIDSLIGEGGMGQVYRAHDGELHRDVAIKVLPPIFALDSGRRARFEREARVLASLNHPRIGAIYGIAEGEGIRGLVLELVDGDTLADRLRLARNAAGGGGLRIQEALTVARQVAEALDAAHEKGIIHRDLKPANIKITPTGDAKVLDFGLAKAAGRGDEPADATSEPRLQDTNAGVILGTAAYMSPEQVQGKPVDKRADIWAFGCVLYEMLTGRAPFARPTVNDTLTAVVDDEPDFSGLPPSLPHVTALVRRCLEKDPRRRLRDIGEALIVLEATQISAPQPAAIAIRQPAVGSLSRMLAALLITASAAGMLVWNLKRSPQVPGRIYHLAVPVSPDARPAALRGLALSPHARQLAYVGERAGVPRLYVTSLDNSETRELAGTEGAAYPFFSPDGVWVAFFTAGRLKKVPSAGGAVQTVVDSALAGIGRGGGGIGGEWSTDNTIWFAANGIWRVSAEGGTPTPVTQVARNNGEISHRSPVLLPDQSTLLYTVWHGPGWDERHVVAHHLRSGEKRLIVKGAGRARYAPSGHLIYTRAGRLMAVRFDASRLQVSGAPVTIRDDIREGTIYADYDVSLDGSLAYVQQHPDTYNRMPVIVDRQGRSQPLTGLAPAYYQGPTISPDGRHLALMTTDSLIDIFIYDFARASLTRLTTEGSSQYPLWTADGKRIVYRGTRAGSRNLFWRPVDLAAGEERLTVGEGSYAPWSMSPDGAVAFDGFAAKTGMDIWLLPLSGDRKPRPLLNEPFNESRPRFSPNGRWLAVVSDRSGRPEVYLQSYPEPRGMWQISTGGGDGPTWARSGRELFFRNGQKMMSAMIADGQNPPHSAPRVLFEGNYIFAEPVIDYDVLPDGQRFVMIQPARSDPPVTHINLVLNWFEELRQRLPAGQ